MIRAASDELLCSGDALWEALCREWAECAGIKQVQDVVDAVAEASWGGAQFVDVLR